MPKFLLIFDFAKQLVIVIIAHSVDQLKLRKIMVSKSQYHVINV